MTKYREIIRLNSLGFSGRNIALTCNVSRNTVSKVLKQASEQNLSWPLDESLTEQKLEELLFKRTAKTTKRRLPSFEYIRKEMMKTGVNKKLLWVEYCNECRMNNEEPLMYSRFC